MNEETRNAWFKNQTKQEPNKQSAMIKTNVFSAVFSQNLKSGCPKCSTGPDKRSNFEGNMENKTNLH